MGRNWSTAEEVCRLCVDRNPGGQERCGPCLECLLARHIFALAQSCGLCSYIWSLQPLISSTEPWLIEGEEVRDSLGRTSTAELSRLRGAPGQTQFHSLHPHLQF